VGATLPQLAQANFKRNGVADKRFRFFKTQKARIAPKQRVGLRTSCSAGWTVLANRAARAQCRTD
jgi:hypothetical protein